MFEWTICAKIDECTGINASFSYQYYVIMRFDNKFSSPSDPATIVGNRLKFNSTLSLDFRTETCQLPAQNLQIMLAYSQMGSPRELKEKNEQIVGIATIILTYPLEQSFTSLKIYKFDKSLYPKANIRASFSITKNDDKSNKQSNLNLSHSSGRFDSEQEDALPFQMSKFQNQKSTYRFLNEQNGSKSTKSIEDYEKWEQILKERNELYKMSEDLYESLKKCMSERDEYLRQLRQKELNEQQIREQLQFLKLKIQAQEDVTVNKNQQSPLHLEQIERISKQNIQIKEELMKKQIQVKQLRRQVKQSFIAIEQFKKQALQARLQLINKEGQISFVSRQSKYLDPYQCIESLYQQLQNRKFEQPFYFIDQDNHKQIAIEKTLASIMKDIAQIFTQIIQRFKMQKDKEWAVQQKALIEAKLNQLLEC